MIAPLSSFPSRIIETDVCIVGSGAAGLTIARRLEARGIAFVLLESGPDGGPPVDDPAYRFTTAGLPISPDSRARCFGGATTRWSGRWRVPEPAMWRARDWVANDGWPLEGEALAAYYVEGERLYDVSPLPNKSARPNWFAGAPIEYSTVRYVPLDHRDFGASFKTNVAASRARVFTGAHVVSIEKAHGQVSQVLAAAVDGALYAVRAARFVLATGGVENARLLLLSDIGNEYDQVGRHYMDHAKGVAGVIEAYEPFDVSQSAYYYEPRRAGFGLRLSNDFRRDNNLLDAHIYLEALNDRSPIGRLTKRLLSRRRASRFVVLHNYLEQTPDPNNRVTLDDEKDAFGLRRARVAWEIGDRERGSIRAFHKVIGDACSRGIGWFESPISEDGDEDLIAEDSSHPMGSTRMGHDPATSVVDANCRVHSSSNLYIVGSSVFPSFEAAGPTATIIALALRLADHLGASR